jgi:hypothetical protein
MTFSSALSVRGLEYNKSNLFLSDPLYTTWGMPSFTLSRRPFMILSVFSLPELSFLDPNSELHPRRYRPWQQTHRTRSLHAVKPSTPASLHDSVVEEVSDPGLFSNLPKKVPSVNSFCTLYITAQLRVEDNQLQLNGAVKTTILELIQDEFKRILLLQYTQGDILVELDFYNSHQSSS